VIFFSNNERLHAVSRFRLTFALISAVVLNACSQGFVNLDFESPIPPLIPDIFGAVPITNALPGWTGYLGDTKVDSVLYNSVSIGAAAISFHGLGSSFTPYHGSYSIILQSSFPSGTTSAATAQTAQIPANARSLLFYTYNVSIHVAFDGQMITTHDLGSAGGTPEYHMIGADIGLLAGKLGELRFS